MYAYRQMDIEQQIWVYIYTWPIAMSRSQYPQCLQKETHKKDVLISSGEPKNLSTSMG